MERAPETLTPESLGHFETFDILEHQSKSDLEAQNDYHSSHCMPHFFRPFFSKIFGSLSSCVSFFVTPYSRKIQLSDGTKLIITKHLAEGGFSFVYLALDKKRHKKYAVKRMLCQTEDRLEHAKWEIDVMNMFSHPNIITLVDGLIHQNENGHCDVSIVMPFYRNGTLADHLNLISINPNNKETFFPNGKSLLQFFSRLSEAVQCFHNHKPAFAVRDIKPENVLIDYNGYPILMDLGSTTLARIRVESRSQALEILENASEHLTSLYSPPELLDIKSDAILDERTDIWALGCVLYTMVYGRPPFELEEGDSIALAVLGNIPYSENTIHFSNPQPVIDLMKAMLNTSIEKRPFIDEVISITNNLINDL